MGFTLSKSRTTLNQLSFGQFCIFEYSERFSNQVFEFWSYQNMIYSSMMQFWMLFHLPVSNLYSNQYSLSCSQTTPNIGHFCSDWKNIDRIANWRLGDEWASRTAYSRDISYCDTIRTQILNWSSSSVFAKMRLCSMINPGNKQWLEVRFRLGTERHRAVQILGGSNLDGDRVTRIRRWH